MDHQSFEPQVARDVFHQCTRDGSGHGLGGSVNSSILSEIESFYSFYFSCPSRSDVASEYTRALNVLSNNDANISVRFYPKYRCALIVSSSQGCKASPCRKLSLLGLGNYGLEFLCKSKQSLLRTTRARSYAVFPLIQMEEDVFGTFDNFFSSEYSEILREDEKKKLDRHKRVNPGLVELMLKRAEQRLKEGGVRSHDIEAGWSEVTSHSGEDWPLLSAVFEYIVSCVTSTEGNIGHFQYQHFECHFQLSLLNKYKDSVKDKILNLSVSNKDLNYCINNMMIFLDSLARQTVNELTGVYAVDDIEESLEKCRNELFEHLKQRWMSYAKSFNMNLFTPNELSAPLAIKVAGICHIHEQNTLQARCVTLKNIDRHPLLKENKIGAILKYIERLETDTRKNEMSFLHLATNTVQNAIFKMTHLLRDRTFYVELTSAETLLNLYRHWNRRLISKVSRRGSSNLKSQLIVEMLSHEMLVVWSVFSFVHATLKHDALLKQLLTNGYGVALNWKDIRYLALSTKCAFEAAVNVAEYLKENTTSKELFHLSYQNHTFDFAHSFALTSPDIQRIWREEQEDARQRENDHWGKVEKQKAELKRLRKQLNEYEEEKTRMYSRLSKLSYSDYNYWDRCRSIESEISSQNRIIDRVKSNIERVKKAPPPVFQPLPQNEDLAFPVLFFLHMPVNLQLLQRLSISAQQMLRPVQEIYCHTALNQKDYKAIEQLMQERSANELSNWTNWSNYYDIHSKKSSSCRVVHIYSSSVPAKEQHVGPQDVEEIYSRSQGIWHPDSLTPQLLWNGGGFALDQRGGPFFNPFIAINGQNTFENFTEKLDPKIQYILVQSGSELTDSKRSNLPIANQEDKPGCFNKQQWLSFANLRAYANQQLRKLCSCLSDRTLKLDEPIVHTLIRQTLYHIGEVSVKSDAIFPLWKTDMLEGHFCEIISAELMDLGNELAGKPSQHMSLFILIEVARYVVQWYEECAAVLKKFIEIIEVWIKDCDDQIKDANIGDVPTLRAKKGVFYHYSILCHSSRDLSESEAGYLCKMVMLAQNETRFEEETSYDEQLKTLTEIRSAVMCEKIWQLLSILECTDKRKMLSEAVKVIVKDTPLDLDWTQILDGDYKTGCFEAADLDDNLYGINLMNGIVLYNGMPLSSLPSSILRHALFQKTFSDRNFETCVSGNVIKTAMPVNGRKYTFRLAEDDLIVNECYEIEEGKTLELRLLNSLNLCDGNSWGYSLPVILKENYSHWYCEKKQIVLFRGLYFLDRNVDFILAFESAEEDALTEKKWNCYRIPSFERNTVWDMFVSGKLILNERYDQLKLIDQSEITKVLAKFEDPSFIHTFTSHEKSKHRIYQFPRFQLEFHSVITNGEKNLVSQDYAGFKLSPCQQLTDTLWGFSRYLVLESTSEMNNTKIVIPQGEVIIEVDGKVTVKTEETSSARLKVYTYDVHPRFNSLVAQSIDARIHLADLYSACSTLLPEARMKMCGKEVAMQLVRRSWTNRPLDENDYGKLSKLSNKSVASPGLELLCYEVACSSLQTSFLHTNLAIEEIKHPSFPSEASVAYMNENIPRNPRSSLTSQEEVRIFGGIRSDYSSQKKFFMSDESSTWTTGTVDRVEDRTEDYEKLLHSIVTYAKKEKCDFIFKNREISNGDVNSSKLYGFMMDNIEASHDAHFELPDMKIGDGFQSLFLHLSKQISEKRAQIEASLFHAISLIPKSCGIEGTNFRILRLANVYPTLTCEDLVKCAIDRKWMDHFNPFLSKSGSDKDNVLHNITVWMKLCVLEDKMSRLIDLSSKCDKNSPEHIRKAAKLQVLQELSVNRVWSVEQHPDWLAFEVVCRLQIRPIQYTIAQSMIQCVEQVATPGPITQLNMGEGKTRVILPMLAMNWRSSDKLVRLNFLSSLLQEAGEYMHNVLTATVIGIPVLHIPFNRDVKLTLAQAATLKVSLEHCSEVGGAILCAPEHRQSFKLKWHELNKCEDEFDEICDVLKALESLPYLDILDEVDEILRTKNKLIYAIGSQEQLASKESRWNVLQGLLQIVTCVSNSGSAQIRDILSNGLVCQGQMGLKDGKFQEFRILPGEHFEKVRSDISRALAETLIAHPPSYELRSLEQLKGSRLSGVVEYVIEPKCADFNNEDLSDSCIDDILALRGFLANGLFVHCLMKRNRVDYGVNREPGAKRKLMAVPFHACETPALRAEFGHPDCALMYSCLAYYYDGLNQIQVEQAFQTLLLLGPSAQEDIYRTWYKQSCSEMQPQHQNSLDTITKVDLSNTILVSLLVRYFAFNTLTINFWLNSCVFPLETMQFPERLEATAWDLAHNSHRFVAGFSGTNDERVIMPASLQWVSQKPVDSHSLKSNLESTLNITTMDPRLSLMGTDGKMLQLLLKAEFQELSCDDEKSQWKTILDEVIDTTTKVSSHHTRALIDAGALMAGAPNNEEVARYLAHRLGDGYRGVVYFDIIKNGWWVRNKFECSWPKHASPIHERDGFVYFDESRTRGADMKLPVNSCAILTLGPLMCKDKLMQAAGRMRMLEHGQKLLLMAAEDVTSQIKDGNGLADSDVTSLHVLRWVMTNTVKNVVKWLPEWAIQGGQFIMKEGKPHLALIPDMTSLNDMYNRELNEKPIYDVWTEKRRAFMNARGDIEKDMDRSLRNMLEEIDDRIERYGKEFNTKTGSNMEQECERELEKEVELEQELQKEVPKREARKETDWDVSHLRTCTQMKDIKRVQETDRLENFVTKKLFFRGEPIRFWGTDLGIKWPKNIQGTHNFFLSCAGDSMDESKMSLNDYLRLVDFFLVFSNGDVVLLSEREADKVLELTWRSNCPNFALMNLTYARKKEENGSCVKFQCPAGRSFPVPCEVVTTLAFFQGLVMFAKEEEKTSLRSVLSERSAKTVAPMFCDMRGLGFSYSRSDLELICTQYGDNAS